MVNAMRYIRLGVCICILLFVHNQILMADEATNADSITTEYIRSIYIEKPKCALKLLDVAENKKSMPLRVIDELRSLSYRNLFMNKLAYVYARKSYVLDSVYQKDPEHLLKMTVYLAELSFLMSKYNESMNYALDGIAQSKRLEDRVSEARLLYCIGENNRMLSFKDKAYDFFDSAIDLLKGRKGVKEIGMLSSFYGGKMSYLMTDSLYEDASVMALEREKQIKKLETLPDVPKGLVDMSKEEKKTYTIKSDENLGEVKIADAVVAIIAGLAAIEVEGVSSMAGNATRELIAKLGMKSLSKGVKVDVLEGIVTVSLALNLKYGSSIKDTTLKVQEKVKAAIENMTGLTVADVNIRVAGVDMPEEE